MNPATHQAETESLLEQREWLQAILAVTADAIVATDRDGKIKFMNASAERLSGWKEIDAQNRRKIDIFHMPRPNCLLSRDGRKRPVKETTVPVHTAGCVTGRIFLLKDKTGRNFREKLLAEANRLATAGTIAGQVAHDLNNMLMVIMSCAELMQEHPAIGAENAERLRLISDSTSRAAALTQKLLGAPRPVKACDAL